MLHAKLHRCLKLFALGLLTLALCASVAAAAVPEPVVVPIGEFTSNLAGSGRHVISFDLFLEVFNADAGAIVNMGGWYIKIKNEILMTTAQITYEDLREAEGILRFAENIKRDLNEILPKVEGQPLVTHVLFDSFILQ